MQVTKRSFLNAFIDYLLQVHFKFMVIFMKVEIFNSLSNDNLKVVNDENRPTFNQISHIKFILEMITYKLHKSAFFYSIHKLTLMMFKCFPPL